jgi:aspartyl-tRNA(Asn)/glutamyl-tRNA(Gln) amidotransferase subunit A
MEGSAVAAIGTDTGGSIRVPAALCGLVGYRASLGFGNWSGAAHLAQSFDTMGWLFRDLRDAPLFSGLFTGEELQERVALMKFAVIDKAFLHDCEPEIVRSLHRTAAELERLGLQRSKFDASFWTDAVDIYAPIQAWEASRIHAGHFDRFPPALRERLDWGARIKDAELEALRTRHAAFRERVDALLTEHHLLVMPAAPVTRLDAGADHSQARIRLLRYTTPFSLAGVPVVTVPCSPGGVQLAATRGSDPLLLALAGRLGAQRAAASNQ